MFFEDALARAAVRRQKQHAINLHSAPNTSFRNNKHSIKRYRHHHNSKPYARSIAVLASLSFLSLYLALSRFSLSLLNCYM